MGNVTTRNAAGAIEAREEFKASALSGRYVKADDMQHLGQLPERFHAAFQEAVETAGDAFPGYVVFSYETPIGWAHWDGRDIIAVVPHVRYSVTTSKHQTQARIGLDVTW